MIKFLKLTAAMTTSAAVLILIPCLIGKTQPPIPFAALFTDANGNRCPKLCMLGITVDSTPASEVYDLFKHHPLTRNLEMKDIGVTYNAGDSDGEFIASYANDGLISHMSWLKFALTPLYRSAEVLQLFGQPDCVQVFGGGYTFDYPQLKLGITIIATQSSNLAPNDAILMVDISGQDNLFDCNKKYTVDWRGFGSAQRYLNAQKVALTQLAKQSARQTIAAD